jgi:hypothetical protein
LDLCRLIVGIVTDLFRSRAALEAELLVLRQQINVLRRAAPKRLFFGSIDRLILAAACRSFPKAYDALAIVRPDTVIRWHRAGFRSYWRWKSRSRPGRPAVPLELRRLICQMSTDNPLWGAPRIHGELLKLGIEVGQTSVAKYMARRRGLVVVEVGMITPPVGMNLFIISSMAPDIRIQQIYRGVLPFLVSDFARTVLLVLVPPLSLGLVHLLY